MVTPGKVSSGSKQWTFQVLPNIDSTVLTVKHILLSFEYWNALGLQVTSFLMCRSVLCPMSAAFWDWRWCETKRIHHLIGITLSMAVSSCSILWALPMRSSYASSNGTKHKILKIRSVSQQKVKIWMELLARIKDNWIQLESTIKTWNSQLLFVIFHFLLILGLATTTWID